jgi:outer membrane receptor protein involved in Fe transport
VSESACISPFSYHPEADPIRPCSVLETIIFDTSRSIGAVFLTEEWKALDVLALNVGIRGQFSSQYSPTVLYSGGIVWKIWKKIFLKANYTQGFRPPFFQATNVNPNLANQVSMLPNPDLKVERSQAIETELNLTLLEGGSVIRRLFIRVDYSYSLLKDLIRLPGGKHQNTGERSIHSVEFLGQLNFAGNHEIWLGYYFVYIQDAFTGPVRNIPNNIITGGFKVNLYKKYLELTGNVVYRGAMEDLDKYPYTTTTSSYFKSGIDSQGNSIVVHESRITDVVVDKIRGVVLLQGGLRVKNIADMLEFNFFAYNMLNVKYYDPDFDWDAQIFSRPYAKPRWSFMANAIVKF